MRVHATRPSRWWPLVACSVWVSGRAAAQAAPVPDRRLVEVADSVSRAEVSGQPLAGLQYAVIRDGRVLAFQSLGMADASRREPVSSAALFRLASVTKVYTAAAVLREAERGRLSLDAPIRRYVDSLPAEWRDIRITDLLGHTSGIPDYSDSTERTPAAVLSPRALLTIAARTPRLFPPGARWKYSNTNYVLLGLALERVTGESWADLMRAMLTPLGLTATAVCRGPGVGGEAIGHRATGSASFTATPPVDVSHPWAAGALCANALEAAEWGAALLDGRVLDTAWSGRMRTPAVLTNGQPAPYGLGLFVDHLEGRTVLAHSGQILGFKSDLVLVPEERLAVAVLTNTDNAPVERISRTIVRTALGLPATTGSGSVAIQQLDEDHAREYTGSFALRGPGGGTMSLMIILDGGRLMARPGDEGATVLRYLGDDTFAPAGGPEARLRFRRSGGQVTGVELRMRPDGPALIGARAP